MNRILPYFKQNFLKISAGILCMIVVDLTQLAIPHIIKQAVDILVDSRFDHRTLVIQCLIITGLGLSMAVLRYFWRIWLMGSARRLEMGIREELYAHILTLDMPYFNRTRTGDIMAHATSDINHVRMAFGMGIIALTDAVLLGSATLAIMFWMNTKLTLVALVPMPFLILLIRYLGKKMHSLHTSAQESYSALTELVRESFSGVRILKAFNFETIISKKVTNYSVHYFQKNFKRALVSSFLRPLMGFFFNLSTFIVLFYGGYLVMQNLLSPGELVAFIQYLGILAWPIIAIGWMTNLVQRGLSSLKRINALLDAEPGVINAPGAVPAADVEHITFHDVSFGYAPGSPALSGITLQVHAGERIGICGPPGSGKTSLAQLIPRLYNVSDGRLLLGDQDIQNLDIHSLRNHVAFMPQEPFLFSGSIRENILMGKSLPNPVLTKVIEICRLTETLNRMPAGIDTIIGEKGVTLSGGQKQRIALARTLVLPKKIIILDDPISQVDTHTASRMIQTISCLDTDAILIIISHRMSALAFCDRIYILNNGRIEHQGRHEDLLEKSSFYKTSCMVQQFEEDTHDD